MKALSRFRDADTVHHIATEIRRLALDRPVRFMEVCGGHTAVIYRSALTDLLPEEVQLLSGPGCPVCVTGNGFIDQAVALAELPEITIATFGDLVRVPGSTRSLTDVRACGCDIQVFYSPMDALTWALKHPDRTVVFLGLGFETTACTLAATLAECVRSEIHNFRFLSSLKTMPPALRALLSSQKVAIDGFILPGHVITVTGLEVFQFIAREFSIPSVVSGFEPSDLMEALLMLCRQIKQDHAEVENQYRRVVRYTGNPQAQALIEKMFEPCDMQWRGFGAIPLSGLKLRPQFSCWDAENIPVEVEPTREHPGCRCGEVLCGIIHPSECTLFGSVCTPETPLGACMVSAEGACAAVYHFAPLSEKV